MNRFGDANDLQAGKTAHPPFKGAILVTFSVFIQAFIAPPRQIEEHSLRN